MSNKEPRRWTAWSNAELQDRLEELREHYDLASRPEAREGIIREAEEIASVLDHREHDSVASGYADYLENIYGEDR